MRVLITGSAGLIGSEAVAYYAARGGEVHGIDNNTRRALFGRGGDTTPTLRWIEATFPGYTHHAIDIRDRAQVTRAVARARPDLIIHCAAQPSHDLAARMPLDDFDINAGGTINLLEAARAACPESPFVHVSTNKVYGDGPNRLSLREEPTRLAFDDPAYADGIGEDFPIDQSLHSLFGASKASADLIAQEYGRYFGMPVGVFRGGCLTGSRHAAVPLHGFLAYLVQAIVSGTRYTVIGYGGKQVRDQIHASDVIAAFDAFASDPRPGEVFNIGGGRGNSASVLEAIDLVERASGRRAELAWEPTARIGDHACYYTDLSRLRSRFPGWSVTRSLASIVEEMVRGVAVRAAA